MKNFSKLIVLLSLLVCSSIVANAHMYLQDGLSWESIDLSAMYMQYASEDHRHLPSTDEALFLNETLQGDTVINGKHYLICRFSYLNYLFTSADGHSGCALRDDESGMYVYSFKEEKEFMLMSYGLQVGDNVCTNPFQPGDEWLCSVESTDSVVLRNGERRRCIYLSDGIHLIEGLGSSKGLWGEGNAFPYVYFLSHSLGETSLHLSDNCDFVAQFKHEACKGIYDVSGHWTRLKITDNAGNECLLHLAVDNSGRTIDYESEDTFAKVQLSRDADEWGHLAVYADAAGENHAFKIAVPADRYPVEVSWDGMSFCDAPWSGSILTDWPSGGWFDATPSWSPVKVNMFEYPDFFYSERNTVTLDLHDDEHGTIDVDGVKMGIFYVSVGKSSTNALDQLSAGKSANKILRDGHILLLTQDGTYDLFGRKVD